MRQRDRIFIRSCCKEELVVGKVIVVGGGAAGMMAAVAAADKGNSVCLIEKNEKLGKKLFITGKGRCNVCQCPLQ